MQDPCACMIYQDSLGQIVCIRCHGDWYACECPLKHSLGCENNPIKKENSGSHS